MFRGHIPLRTCVVCGAKASKGDLVRVVRSQSGGVEVDATGKKPGRGSYLCYNLACWDKALKKNRLEHTLRGPIAAEDRQALREFAQRVTAVPLQG